MAGQSQGGGHAALLAMQRRVRRRVLMFGSPKDFNIHFGQPARWYSGPNATPLGRFFSFAHGADEGHGMQLSRAVGELSGPEAAPPAIG